MLNLSFVASLQQSCPIMIINANYFIPAPPRTRMLWCYDVHVYFKCLQVSTLFFKAKEEAGLNFSSARSKMTLCFQHLEFCT